MHLAHDGRHHPAGQAAKASAAFATAPAKWNSHGQGSGGYTAANIVIFVLGSDDQARVVPQNVKQP